MKNVVIAKIASRRLVRHMELKGLWTPNPNRPSSPYSLSSPCPSPRTIIPTDLTLSGSDPTQTAHSEVVASVESVETITPPVPVHAATEQIKPHPITPNTPSDIQGLQELNPTRSTSVPDYVYPMTSNIMMDQADRTALIAGGEYTGSHVHRSSGNFGNYCISEKLMLIFCFYFKIRNLFSFGPRPCSGEIC